MKIHCLVHLEFETLGNIKDWVQSKGYTISLTMPCKDSFYPGTEEFDLLIIMGGLMSVYQEDEYPWLIKEKEFVRNAIESGKSVYGICFGAQMLSELLGGTVSRNKFREIGWHKVQSLDAFNKDASLFDCPSEFTILQWHGDTFTLPEGAARLFESEACLEQGFIYGSDVLAVQFHPEADEQCVESLLTQCSSDLVEGRYIQSGEEIRGRSDLLESSSNLMFKILDWFESNIKAKENVS